MIHLINSDCQLTPLAPDSVHCAITSPPYWGLRSYSGNMIRVWPPVDYIYTGDTSWKTCEHAWEMESRTMQTGGPSATQQNNRGVDGSGWQAFSGYCSLCGAWRGPLGLEDSLDQYVSNTVVWCREVWRVLRPDGTFWLNLGDSYNGSGGAGGDYNAGGLKAGQPRYPGRNSINLKPKDLVGIPWRVALALQADGWWLRSDIIWHKPNPMPESVTDRPTKAHEYVFLMTKSARYYYDADAVREKHSRPWWNETVGPKYMPPGIGRNDRGKREGDGNPSGRNRRTVWTIATKAYSGMAKTSHLAPVPVHEACDGTIYIAFPDCPLHGDQFVPLAREFYGGHEADYWSRIADICDRLALRPFADSAPTDQQRAQGYEVQSSGYFPHSYSPTAIDHNNEIHRMALALDSTPPYIPFFEKAYYIADKRELLSSFVQHLCIYGNSILVDDSDANLLTKIPHRILDSQTASHLLASDTSMCTCLYYRYFTRTSDHFATFPPALVEPCVKAGTSERGVCRECGAPWERVVETYYQPVKYPGGVEYQHSPQAQKYGRARKIDTTTGWRPTCDHDTDPIPATVYDPFAGSGTTLMVARKLGRDAVGTDLSGPYLHEQARKRLHLEALHAWEHGVEDDSDLSDLPMFASG